MPSEGESESPYQREYLQAISEHFKHLTTLATGSIFLLIGFLEKIFKNPQWRLLVVISLISFTVTILLSTKAHANIVSYFRINVAYTEEEWNKDWHFIQSYWHMAWVAFNVGVVGLVIFGIRNLF